MIAGKILLPALMISGIQAVYAYPKTYELANETDTICVVADNDVEPAIPFDPDTLGWDFAEIDTVYQSTDEGITQYRMTYNHFCAAKLGRAEGSGLVFADFEQYDYPYSEYYSFYASIRFTFEKGNKKLTFLAYQSFLTDYDGVGVIPAQFHPGLQVGKLFFMEGYLNDIGIFQKTLVLRRITDGVAQCSGTKKAWNFPDEGGEVEPEEPNCNDGAGHGHRHHKWGKHRPWKSHFRHR